MDEPEDNEFGAIDHAQSDTDPTSNTFPAAQFRLAGGPDDLSVNKGSPTMKMRRAILDLSAAIVLVAIVLATSLWTAGVAMARKSFDGAWSVLIVTDAGGCDRAYRYALRIANGRISYDDAAFDVSGNVDARGHVNVRVSAGGQHASGSGQLSGDSGQGRWTGRSSNSSCSGHWEAARRG